MKQLFFTLMILLTAIPVLAASGNPWEQKLPFKEAIISYQISGTQTGKATMYVKNYGQTSAVYRDVTTKIMGMSNREESIAITTPDWVYDIDITNKSGSKQVNPQKYFAAEYEQLSPADQKKVTANAEKLGLSTLVSLDGKMEKNAATILGYQCDKVMMMGTSIYSISDCGLVLKSETDMMGMKINEVATKIDKRAVSSNKFKVPTGITITSNPAADEMAKTHVQMTVQSILDGELPYSRMKRYNPSPEEQQQEMTPEMQEQIQQMMKMFGGQG